MQCVSMSCSVFPYVAVCCRRSRCVAVRCVALNPLLEYENLLSHLLQCVVVCCSILQCIALSCSAARCAAMFGIMLWSGVMCCSEAKCVAVRQGALK